MTPETARATPYFTTPGVTIYCGDALEILPYLNPVDVVITDPVWPRTKNASMAGDLGPWELFTRAVKLITPKTKRLIVILGCDSDPRFLKTVPAELPYLVTCWLRRIPPVMKGNIVFGAEVAYVFGQPFPWEHTKRILTTECFAVSRGRRDFGNDHPCPRNIAILDWLISKYTAEGQTVLDPFCGSGTTLAAALKAGRKAIGIDIVQHYCDLAAERCRQLPFPTSSPNPY